MSSETDSDSELEQSNGQGKTFLDDSDAQARFSGDFKNDKRRRNARDNETSARHSSLAIRSETEMLKSTDPGMKIVPTSPDGTSSAVRFNRGRPFEDETYLAHSPPESPPVERRITARGTSVSAKTMLQYMRATQGRMEGQVSIRLGDRSPWQATYCAITKSGALQGDQEDEDPLLATRIQHIRGCHVWALQDPHSQFQFLHIRSANGREEMQLQPLEQLDFDYWFAAFLCWQSAHMITHCPKPPTQSQNERITGLAQDHLFTNITAGVIHSDSAILLELSKLNSNDSPHESARTQPHQLSTLYKGFNATERRIQCLLHEDGTVALRENNSRTLAAVVLGGLPKSAIQRIDKQVFNRNRIIGIYPQYALGGSACSRIRPIFLSYESTRLFETWFILLRAFAATEVYSPQPSASRISSEYRSYSTWLDLGPLPAFLRTAASLSVAIGKIVVRDEEEEKKNSPRDLPKSVQSADSLQALLDSGELGVQILVDEQVKANMNISTGELSPSWSERHIVQDLPDSSSAVTVLLGSTDRAEPLSFDFHSQPQANIQINELESGNEDEAWPIVDNNGSVIGDISLNLQFCREHILPEREYDHLLNLLSNTSNGLTVKIWQYLPAQLTALAECFVNIFQSSGLVIDWFKYLAAEEIDNGSSSAKNSRRVSGREVADSAISESSVLFRGNSLLTKALDFYQRRVAASYLETTLGHKLRRILLDDLDCEVDPSKLADAGKKKLSDSWENLINITNDVWRSIYESRSLCPVELKVVLRHIRACARTRFGDDAPMVGYSSVSAFLFLRFFCAAIMNPHLFGLIEGEIIESHVHKCILRRPIWHDRTDSDPKGRPSARAARTYVLVAKSIQGLANLTSSAKESWMSPMNNFYTTRRQEFTDFVDSICDISDAAWGRNASSVVAPSSVYDSALSIIEQLPPSAREEPLALPYLIDQPRSLAAVVQLWMNNFQQNEPPRDASEPRKLSNQTPQGSNLSPRTVTLRTLTSVLGDGAFDEDLVAFHTAARSLADRTEALAAQAASQSSSSSAVEDVDDENSVIFAVSQKWINIAEAMEVAPEQFWVDDVPPASASNLVAPTSAAKAGRNSKRPQIRGRASSGMKRGGRMGASATSLAPKDKNARPDSSAGRSDRATRPKSSGKRPSSPARSAEEQAFRKLGWM